MLFAILCICFTWHSSIYRSSLVLACLIFLRCFSIKVALWADIYCHRTSQDIQICMFGVDFEPEFQEFEQPLISLLSSHAGHCFADAWIMWCRTVGWHVNESLSRMWKEASVASCKVLSQNLFEGTQGNNLTPQRAQQLTLWVEIRNWLLILEWVLNE